MWNNPQTKSGGLFQLIIRELIIRAQLIIRAIVLSFIFFAASSEASRNHATAILKIIAEALFISGVRRRNSRPIRTRNYTNARLTLRIWIR